MRKLFPHGDTLPSSSRSTSASSAPRMSTPQHRFYSLPCQPMTPAHAPSHRIVLPGSLITDPSLPPSFSILSLSLPLGQPLRYSRLLPHSARLALRDLQPPLGLFPPSSWSNAASLWSNDPLLDDVANRLSSPPLDLASAVSGCSSAALSSSRLSQRRAVPAATSADDHSLSTRARRRQRRDSDNDCDSTTALPLVSLPLPCLVLCPLCFPRYPTPGHLFVISSSCLLWPFYSCSVLCFPALASLHPLPTPPSSSPSVFAPNIGTRLPPRPASPSFFSCSFRPLPSDSVPPPAASHLLLRLPALPTTCSHSFASLVVSHWNSRTSNLSTWPCRNGTGSSPTLARPRCSSPLPTLTTPLPFGVGFGTTTVGLSTAGLNLVVYSSTLHLTSLPPATPPPLDRPGPCLHPSAWSACFQVLRHFVHHSHPGLPTRGVPSG